MLPLSQMIKRGQKNWNGHGVCIAITRRDLPLSIVYHNIEIEYKSETKTHHIALAVIEQLRQTMVSDCMYYATQPQLPACSKIWHHIMTKWCYDSREQCGAFWCLIQMRWLHLQMNLRFSKDVHGRLFHRHDHDHFANSQQCVPDFSIVSNHDIELYRTLVKLITAECFSIFICHR